MHFDSKMPSGSLIKAHFEDNSVGFSDFFFKHLPLLPSSSSSKNSSADKFLSPLFRKTLQMAYADAQARKNRCSLYMQPALLRSHYLISDIKSFDFSSLKKLLSAEYRIFKLKVHPNMKTNEEFFDRFQACVGSSLDENIKFRFDFNAKFDLSFVNNFLSFYKKKYNFKIEFIEDPVPYDKKKWEELRGHFDIPLAIDFEWGNFLGSLSKKPLELPFEVIVLKPSYQDLDSIIKRFKDYNVRFVITHFMDHVVGRMHAVAEAQKVHHQWGKGLFLECGFKGAERGQFASGLDMHDDAWVRVDGSQYGVGFDKELAALDWDDISWII